MGPGVRPEWGASPAKPSKPLHLFDQPERSVGMGRFVGILVGPPELLLTLVGAVGEACVCWFVQARKFARSALN